MKATSEDLRYRIEEVLGALNRRETVDLYVRGKLKAHIVPPDKSSPEAKVVDHPFFGSRTDDQGDVAEIMNRNRAPRHRAF